MLNLVLKGDVISFLQNNSLKFQKSTSCISIFAKYEMTSLQDDYCFANIFTSRIAIVIVFWQMNIIFSNSTLIIKIDHLNFFSDSLNHWAFQKFSYMIWFSLHSLLYPWLVVIKEHDDVVNQVTPSISNILRLRHL